MDRDNEIWEAVLKYGCEVAKTQSDSFIQAIEFVWGERETSFPELSEWVLNNEDPLYAPLWSVSKKERKKNKQIILDDKHNPGQILYIVMWTIASNIQQGYIYQSIYYKNCYSETEQKIYAFNFQENILILKPLVPHHQKMQTNFIDLCILFFSDFLAYFYTPRSRKLNKPNNNEARNKHDK